MLTLRHFFNELQLTKQPCAAGVVLLCAISLVAKLTSTRRALVSTFVDKTHIWCVSAVSVFNVFTLQYYVSCAFVCLSYLIKGLLLLYYGYSYYTQSSTSCTI